MAIIIIDCSINLLVHMQTENELIKFILSFSFCFCFCHSCYTERLINAIEEIKKALAYKYGRPTENTEDTNLQIDNFASNATSKCLLSIHIFVLLAK